MDSDSTPGPHLIGISSRSNMIPWLSLRSPLWTSSVACLLASLCKRYPSPWFLVKTD
jgi:hypothetical protein